MLKIQAEGAWREETVPALVNLMLEGKVERCTPARDTLSAEAEGMLERFLRQPHFEELARQVLARLKALYRHGSACGTSAASHSPAQLSSRLGELSTWDWPDSVTRGRLLWAAAWAAELGGSFEKALTHYDAFLEQRTPEEGLELLAYNNRGVLRIQLGSVDGVRDLARAALRIAPARADSRLPAACFNLLNLINHSLGFDSLAGDVEGELCAFLEELPKETREKWLGQDPRDSTAPAPILLAPTFERLNRLTTRLAAAAMSIAPKPQAPQADLHAFVSGQLELWDSTLDGEVAGSARPPHARYAEAASLLYAGRIPSTFLPRECSTDWTERQVEESFQRSKDYLDAGEHDLARASLESALQALASRNGNRRVLVMRERLETQLAIVLKRKEARDQLRLHEESSALRRDVAAFCRENNYFKAQLEAQGLLRRLEELQLKLRQAWGEESAFLIEDLGQSIRRHQEELERRERRAHASEHLERLRALWPDDWTKAVPEAAYQAVAEGRLNDPEGRLAAWDELKAQLDQHRAQHHFQKLLQDLASGEPDRKRAEESLGLVLRLDPALEVAAAPVFGLLRLPEASHARGEPDGFKTELLEAASRLLSAHPPGMDQSSGNPAPRRDLVREACQILQKLFRAFIGAADKTYELWNGLTEGFTAAIEEGRPDFVEEIERMVAACLEVCPPVAAGKGAVSDPRNPLKLLLETAKKAKVLGRGEEALNASPPRFERAAAFFEEALELGSRDRRQLRRAAAGLYLARHGRNDPPELQRRLLDALDAWVDALPDDGCESVRAGDIAAKIDATRRKAGSAEKPPVRPAEAAVMRELEPSGGPRAAVRAQKKLELRAGAAPARALTRREVRE